MLSSKYVLACRFCLLGSLRKYLKLGFSLESRLEMEMRVGDCSVQLWGMGLMDFT